MINPYFTYEIGDMDDDRIALYTTPIKVIFLEYNNNMELYIIAGFNL